MGENDTAQIDRLAATLESTAEAFDDYLLLANARLMRDQLPEAKRAVERALELDGRNVPANGLARDISARSAARGEALIGLSEERLRNALWEAEWSEVLGAAGELAKWRGRPTDYYWLAHAALMLGEGLIAQRAATSLGRIDPNGRLSATIRWLIRGISSNAPVAPPPVKAPIAKHQPASGPAGERIGYIHDTYHEEDWWLVLGPDGVEIKRFASLSGADEFVQMLEKQGH